MDTDINHLLDKFNKIIKANFIKPISMTAIIKSVDVENNYFIIKSQNSDQIFNCVCGQNNEQIKKDLSLLKENDMIDLNGTIEFNSHTNDIYILVQYFYQTNKKERFDKNITEYNKLKKSLHGEKLKPYIKKFNEQKLPTNIINIGLVVPPDNNQNLDNFIKIFSEKCVGDLYIYNLEKKATHTTFSGKETSMTFENELHVGLDYFKRYRQVDIVCILSNQLSMDNILKLSTRENIKYLINRKNYPCLVSIIGKEEKMEPLCALLSNKKFYDLKDCVDFIFNIQNSNREIINGIVDTVSKQLDLFFEMRQKQIFEMELQLEEMNNPQFYKYQVNDSFCTVKELVLKQLDNEKIKMLDMENEMMKKILEDTRIKQLLIKLAESEQKILNLKKEEVKIITPKKDDNEQIPKKIENTTLLNNNNNNDDKLNINIQHQNGEF